MTNEEQPTERRSYTLEERRAIVQEAKATAAKLLQKLETLAYMEGVHEGAVAVDERTQDGGSSSGATPA